MSWIKNAFAIKSTDPKDFTPAEHALLEKLADKVYQRGMALPAILFLETVQPLNFVASQVMVFFKPFISAFFSTKEYDLLSSLLEDRNTIELLLRKIEILEQNKTEGNKNLNGS